MELVKPVKGGKERSGDCRGDGLDRIYQLCNNLRQRYKAYVLKRSELKEHQPSLKQPVTVKAAKNLFTAADNRP
jgi:hypothetical protein